jgi:hypothetical protein
MIFASGQKDDHRISRCQGLLDGFVVAYANVEAASFRFHKNNYRWVNTEASTFLTSSSSSDR